MMMTSHGHPTTRNEREKRRRKRKKRGGSMVANTSGGTTNPPIKAVTAIDLVRNSALVMTNPKVAIELTVDLKMMMYRMPSGDASSCSTSS
jgi:hypothetical protein